MKYTDEQIKKALECCAYWHVDNCEKCPFDDECGDNGDFLLQKSLDIINRQEAEIERLTAERDNEHRCYLHICEDLKQAVNRNITAKSEAIKEFAEMLKKKASQYPYYQYGIVYAVSVDDIDNLVKEMVGEGE